MEERIVIRSDMERIVIKDMERIIVREVRLEIDPLGMMIPYEEETEFNMNFEVDELILTWLSN